MKLRVVCAALACAFLLAGCAAGEGSAAVSSVEPSVSTAAEPAITPEPTAEPTPEPTPTPTPDPSSLLEYTTLPLDDTKEAPANFWWSDFTPNNEASKKYGLQFAMGLYNSDIDTVRSACSDSVLTNDFPLGDLDGLNVTEFYLSGGTYDVPCLTLTITNPGATPLLRGRHTYTISFDSEGKLNWMSPYSPGEDFRSDLQYANFYKGIRNGLSLVAYVSAEPTDPLGLTGGPGELYYYESYQEGKSDTQDLGPASAPPYGIKIYNVPPEGNSLTEEQLTSVCETLNQRFAALADGSFQSSFYNQPGNNALLSGWDAAVPLPVSVTPDYLRSFINDDPTGSPTISIWVPLPQNCWAVYTTMDISLSEDSGLINPVFYQSVPTALAAVLAQ